MRGLNPDSRAIHATDAWQDASLSDPCAESESRVRKNAKSAGDILGFQSR